MYGAMREHAPSSTRLTGVFTAATMTVALGYALANGMGGFIVTALPEPIAYVALDEAPKDVPPPVTTTQLEVSSDLRLPLVKPLFVADTFEVEQSRVTTSATSTTRPDPRVATPQPPPRQPVRVAAKMLAAATPDYPLSDVRRRNEGTTSLEVCLDMRGQVTSASITRSSGHASLDNAALKWVRDMKFTPAQVDGVPQVICGHPVIYEWRLDRR